MKWTESIMLRTAGKTDRSIQKLLDQIVGPLAEPGLIDISLYRHATFSGDYAITFLWDTEEPRSWGSDLALALKHELKQRGLVDLSVWIPLENGKWGTACPNKKMRRLE